jgi:TolA-binding protein
MPTAPPISRNPALEAHLFWHRFKTEIFAAIVIVILAIIGFGGYRLYSERRDSAGSALLAEAKNAQDYEQVIARYPSTPAAAAAHLLLAQAQRNDRKFMESNATLQVFIDKNPNHELVSSARMAIAANLESMGKIDEPLSMYQQIAANYPESFNAPFALISQVHLLKAKNQNDAARRVCETILTKYRVPGDHRAEGVQDNRVESFWAAEAMRELRSLKPADAAKATGAPTILPPTAGPSPVPSVVRPPLAVPTPPPAAPPRPTGKPR